jgi:hypothetical protein
MTVLVTDYQRHVITMCDTHDEAQRAHNADRHRQIRVRCPVPAAGHAMECGAARREPS